MSSAVPPFDPDMAEKLAEARQNRDLVTPETLESSRRQMAQGQPADLTAGGAVEVTEHLVPRRRGSAGSDTSCSDDELSLLVLQPAEAEGPLPGIVYLHPGGFVMGTARSGIDALLPYVAAGQAVLVSVEYRLAPENPDPAPANDAYSGLAYAGAQADQLGIDPQRLIVAGISAGGGLAAGAALRARDEGFPHISHQVLLSPMLDDRLKTPSSRMLNGEGFWEESENLFAWTAVLGQRRGRGVVSPYAAPSRAHDLSGLPRTYMDVGSSDTFRDEVMDFATRLSQAGVSVDMHMWGGGFHSFESFAPEAPLSRASFQARDEFLRRVLGE